MSEQTPKIDSSKLLTDMYQDGYFPDFLVDKVRDSILQACREIEQQNPGSHEELYAITCRATDRINELAAEFEDNESELETGAREDIADTFAYVAEFYGFPDADMEELTATRDW